MSKYQLPLSLMGFSISFADNNGKNFWAGVDPLKKAATAGLLLFSGALLLALALCVFLYLRQQRRNFSISRVLGVPAKECTRQLLLPLAVIGAASILGGGLASWNYSLRQAVDSLSRIPTPAGVMPSATLQPLWLAGLCASVFVLLLGFSWAGLRILTHKPVLAQLQEGAAPAKGKTTMAGLPTEETIDLNMQTLVLPQLEALAVSGKIDDHALLRHTQRHLLRSAFKSSLTLAVALGFVLTLGWLRWNLERNRAEVERLYQTTSVQADLLVKDSQSVDTRFTKQLSISNIFPRKLVAELVETGLVEKAYLETSVEIALAQDQDTGRYKKLRSHLMIASNDLNIAHHQGMLKGAEFQFLPGYDEAVFSKEWAKEELETALPPVIVPADILEADGLQLGETVT